MKDYIKKRQLLPHLAALLSHMDDWVAKKLVDKERIEQDYLKYLLAWMIEGHFNLGDYRKARELLERDLPFIERHGEKHFEFANALTNIGTIYSKLGNREKAIELLEKALKLKEEHYGNNHLECANALVALGSAHGTFGYHIKAKVLIERALPILQEHCQSDPSTVANALVKLGNAYWKLGNPSKTKELLEESLLILKKHYEDDHLEHLEYANALVTLGNAYGDLGNHEKKGNC